MNIRNIRFLFKFVNLKIETSSFLDYIDFSRMYLSI